jgi:DNA-binding PadR family transcriptional regulator
MWVKKDATILGDFEQLTMLAVLRLGDGAYGAAIQREIEAQADRLVSINAVYTTLDRLESKRLLRSWVGEPTPQRGGRRKKFYGIEPMGLAAVGRAYRAFRHMAKGFEHVLERA